MPGREPDNGDELRFTSSDGNSELACFGGYNINDDTVSSLYNERILLDNLKNFISKIDTNCKI